MTSEPKPESACQDATRPAARISPRQWLGAGTILALVLAAYWPALRGGFVWDDPLLIDKNPLVKGTLTLGSVWFQTDFPLTTVAFWLQWLVWGKHAAGYHAVNLLLHTGGALLVWRVLARLKVAGAWLAAAIFAVHPVGAASVAWISELKNTLSLPFFLLSLDCYLAFERREASAKAGSSSQLRCQAAWWYRLSLLAFLLALLSKTSTVMLPVVLLACAAWQRRGIQKRDWIRTAPFFLLALIFGLFSIWFQTHQAGGNERILSEGFPGRLAGAGMAACFYLGKALLPLNLTMIYPRWTIDVHSPWSWAPALALCALFGLGWGLRRSWGRPLLFGLGCFTVLLFPVLGFFDMYFLALSRVSDHLQYLSLIAFSGLLAAALTSVRGPRPPSGVVAGAPAGHIPPEQSDLPFDETSSPQDAGRGGPGQHPGRAWSPFPTAPMPLVVVAGVLLAAYAVLTCQRAQVLANDETLWRDTLAKNPAAWTARNNLGCLLAEQGKYDAAREQFEASLKLNPRNPQAHSNLGRLLAMDKRLPEAESHLNAALDIKPLDPDAHRSLGGILLRAGRVREAIAQLREAQRIEPALETQLQLAGVLRGTGQARDALAEYRQIIASKPDCAEALNNLAWLLATAADAGLRDGAEAVRLAERANRLAQGKDVIPLGTLAAAYAESGRFEEAVTTARKGLDLATAAGDARMADLSRQLLRLYQAGRPFHER